LKRCYEMSDLGEIKHYLGIEVIRSQDGFQLCQRSYINSMLQQFNMTDCKPASIPMHPDVVLSKSMSPQTEEEKREMDRVPYREFTSSLLYAATWTRPDIAVAVSILCRYNSCYGRQHWEAAKQVLAYLKGTIDLCLTYNKCKDYQPVLYCDADHQRCQDDRKSVSASTIFLGGNLISWYSKKQGGVTYSSSESEYVSLNTGVRELLWTIGILPQMNMEVSMPVEVFEDNQSCIALAKTHEVNSRTKHIDAAFHHIRDLVDKNVVKLTYCQTERMVADILTKPLPIPQFNALREKLNMKPVISQIDA